MKRTSDSTVLVGSLALVLGGLGFVLWQLNSIEHQIITQNQQLRLLGEGTERVSAELARLKAGNAPAAGQPSAECRVDNPLHPEVKDFLSPAEAHRAPPGVPNEGTFRYGYYYGDPKTLNPVLSNAGEVGDWISSYLDAPLANRNRWTNPEEWRGEMACRIEVTEDFREYTIYLRHGVHWSVPSGVELTSPKYAWLKGEHPLTAHDYVFALDMMMNPQVENGFAKNYYEDLESWKALDDYTLVVRWKKKTYQSTFATAALSPIPKFLYAFTEDGTEYPKETIGLKLNQHWYNNKGYVGAGSYRMTKYEPGRVIELERNEDYFGDKPPIQHVSYPIYTDQNQTVLRLKAKEIDLGLLRAGQYREEVLQWSARPKSEWPKDDPFLNGQVQCKVIEAPQFDYIGWNADKPLFSDARVRTAMTLSLRRREIIEKVFAGLGDLAVGPYLPETGYHDPTIDPLEFDLERAKKLLHEAGWIDTDHDGLLDKQIDGRSVPFAFTLLVYGGSPEHISQSNIFKEDLLRVGIRLKIETAEWSLMQKKMDEKQFDAFTGAWGMSWESDPYQIWHSSQADVPKGSNRIGFRNKDADLLIERARATFDPDERRDLLRKIHRIIYDQQAYTFVRRRKVPYCWNTVMQGVEFARLRPQADFSTWYVAKDR